MFEDLRIIECHKRDECNWILVEHDDLKSSKD